MTAADLNPEFRNLPDFRNLIDARLDAIEQVLLRVLVSYSERRHIVGEVETQIFELLARRTENPTKEDVVAILDSLDPPESYIPEELRNKPVVAAIEPAPARPAGPRVSRLAVGSAVLVALILMFAIPLLVTSHGRDTETFTTVFGVNLFVATLLGIAALVRVLRSDGRLRGLPFALFAALPFPLIVVNVLTVALVVATDGVLPWIVTIAAIGYLNFLGIRRLWRWLGQRHGNITESLRGDFARWFAPRNGVQPT